jgi:hypothetical protein
MQTEKHDVGKLQVGQGKIDLSVVVFYVAFHAFEHGDANDRLSEPVEKSAGRASLEHGPVVGYGEALKACLLCAGKHFDDGMQPASAEQSMRMEIYFEH